MTSFLLHTHFFPAYDLIHGCPGNLAFKELCKKVKRAFAQARIGEMKWIGRSHVYYAYIKVPALRNVLWSFASSFGRKSESREVEKKATDWDWTFPTHILRGEMIWFLLTHHFNTEEILPWISTLTEKNFRMNWRWKKKMRNKPNHKHTQAWAQSFKRVVLMYCEILTKAKRSMNYTNWPTSRREWKRGANARAKRRKVASAVNLPSSSFFIFFHRILQQLFFWFSSIAVSY